MHLDEVRQPGSGPLTEKQKDKKPKKINQKPAGGFPQRSHLDI
jgi:hypothetical protein